MLLKDAYRLGCGHEGSNPEPSDWESDNLATTLLSWLYTLDTQLYTKLHFYKSIVCVQPLNLGLEGPTWSKKQRLKMVSAHIVVLYPRLPPGPQVYSPHVT